MNYAITKSGKRLPYIYKPDPPSGSMKYTFFSPEKDYVIQFYKDPKMSADISLRKRLEAIVGKYNPTLSEKNGGSKGTTEKTAEYFSKTFCWPMDIVESPEFGIVCPAYPSNFFFDSKSSLVLNLNGKDKRSTWFTEPQKRRYLEADELGNLKNSLKMCLLLSQSIRRIHQAGLAHSDLSCNNVLIDPKNGLCVVIDIDCLVVPDIFPPEVLGTSGYMAPEVMASLTDSYSKRLRPCVYTDLHSLAVLMYEYIFFRHPLLGPKIYSTRSEGANKFLALGAKATFIENPNDTSNKPSYLRGTIKDLGEDLEKLFIRAFCDGLHNPEERPTALEWEKALQKTYNLLHKCPNRLCEQKWFILKDIKNPVCHFCNSHVKNENIVRLKIKKALKGIEGNWKGNTEVDVYENFNLYKWHIYANVYNDEKSDKIICAAIIKDNEKWLILNKNINTLISPLGFMVPIGKTAVLNDKDIFKIEGNDGVIIEINILRK